MTQIKRQIAEWALPLLEPNPLKGAAGGRASGKSHDRVERLLERHEQDPNLRSVCIREIQKSINFSSYQLIKDKIIKFGLENRFEVLRSEIRDRLGNGIIIFQGMQDHTSYSIKSLEGFDIAWFEEAQRASHRSLGLLIPTILRKKDAECWFTWNPDQPDDAIEKLAQDPDFKLVRCNYMDNPFRDESVDRQAEKMRQRDLDAHNHIWLGGYNVKSDAQIFKGKWTVREFEPHETWKPLHGLDWGFSQDPTAAVRCYLENEKLYIYQEAGKVGLELEDTATYMKHHIPDIEKYPILCDSARPESISHVKTKNKRGDALPLAQSVKKWAGSIEDGIAFIRGLEEIVIHPSCKEVQDEFRLYSYQIDKATGEPTRKIVDKHNHYIDAIRYSLVNFIEKKGQPRIRTL